MPSRNIVKQYVEGGYYHLYNRGVNKCDIFLDDQDYRVFLSLLKQYLAPADPNDLFSKSRKDLSSNVELNAYCLMRNHFSFKS